MLQDFGLDPWQTLVAMIIITILLAAPGDLIQLIWPAANISMFMLVTVGYFYWVKRRGWGVTAKDLKQVGAPWARLTGCD